MHSWNLWLPLHVRLRPHSGVEGFMDHLYIVRTHSLLFCYDYKPAFISIDKLLLNYSSLSVAEKTFCFCTEHRHCMVGDMHTGECIHSLRGSFIAILSWQDNSSMWSGFVLKLCYLLHVWIQLKFEIAFSCIVLVYIFSLKDKCLFPLFGRHDHALQSWLVFKGCWAQSHAGSSGL